MCIRETLEETCNNMNLFHERLNSSTVLRISTAVHRYNFCERETISAMSFEPGKVYICVFKNI